MTWASTLNAVIYMTGIGIAIFLFIYSVVLLICRKFLYAKLFFLYLLNCIVFLAGCSNYVMAEMINDPGWKDRQDLANYLKRMSAQLFIEFSQACLMYLAGLFVINLLYQKLLLPRSFPGLPRKLLIIDAVLLFFLTATAILAFNLEMIDMYDKYHVRFHRHFH